MAIPIDRIIDKLDRLLSSDKSREAEDLLIYWLGEAENDNDLSGALSILNEQIGFYRRYYDEDKGLKAIDSALDKMTKIGEQASFSTFYVNIATTYKAFGKLVEATNNYTIAEELFVKYERTDTYEYAAYLNNVGTLYSELGLLVSARISFEKAIDILEHLGSEQAQIAISYVNIAELTDASEEKIEKCLDLAWEYINKAPFPRGGDYAFVCEKLAPSFEKFGRTYEAKALRDVAGEIYDRS